MLLANTYVLDDEDFNLIENAGINPETYLVGTFLSDLCDVGFEELVDNVRLKDFRVREISYREYEVGLVSLTNEQCQNILRCINEYQPVADRWTIRA